MRQRRAILRQAVPGVVDLPDRAIKGATRLGRRPGRSDTFAEEQVIRPLGNLRGYEAGADPPSGRLWSLCHDPLRYCVVGTIRLASHRARLLPFLLPFLRAEAGIFGVGSGHRCSGSGEAWFAQEGQ